MRRASLLTLSDLLMLSVGAYADEGKGESSKGKSQRYESRDKDREGMGKRRLKTIADRGYYSGLELKACEDAGIAALVPRLRYHTASIGCGRWPLEDILTLTVIKQSFSPINRRSLGRWRCEVHLPASTARVNTRHNATSPWESR